MVELSASVRQMRREYFDLIMDGSDESKYKAESLLKRFVEGATGEDRGLGLTFYATFLAYNAREEEAAVLYDEALAILSTPEHRLWVMTDRLEMQVELSQAAEASAAVAEINSLYRRCSQTDPDVQAIKSMAEAQALRVLVLLGRSQIVVKKAKQMLLTVQLPSVHLALAEACEALGLFDQASAAYEVVVAKVRFGHYLRRIWLKQARVAQRMNDHAKAARCVDKMINSQSLVDDRLIGHAVNLAIDLQERDFPAGTRLLRRIAARLTSGRHPIQLLLLQGGEQA